MGVLISRNNPSKIGRYNNTKNDMYVQVAGDYLISPQIKWVIRSLQINFGSALLKVGHNNGGLMQVLSLQGGYLSEWACFVSLTNVLAAIPACAARACSV